MSYFYPNYILENETKSDIQTDFFGKKVSTPIIAAPLIIDKGSVERHCNFYRLLLNDFKKENAIVFFGDGGRVQWINSHLELIKKIECPTAYTLSPVNFNELVRRIELLEKEKNLLAIGICLDQVFLPHFAGRQDLELKTKKELKDIVSITKKPFFLKGIITKKDSENAISLGAKAIYFSNHGNRTYINSPPVLEFLKEDFCNNGVTIIADGKVNTGVDVYNYLRAGADFVGLGTRLIVDYAQKMSFQKDLNTINMQLANLMYMANFKTLADFKEFPKNADDCQ